MIEICLLCAHTISIEDRHVALWVKPPHFQISKFPKVNYYCDFNFHWKSFNPFRNDAKLQTICIDKHQPRNVLNFNFKKK